MSRAMNVKSTEAEIVATATALGVSLSSVEGLLPSGTRVVCLNAHGAALLRAKVKNKLIVDPVSRAPRTTAPSTHR